MVWAPPQNIGDTDPLIPDAKRYLRKFSYGQGLGETNEYTLEFGIALRQWQANIWYQVEFKGRPGPQVNQTGVFGWAEKKQMGLLPMPFQPVIFTIAGHLGAWDSGPAYLAARWMEEQGLIRLQGVGYDNVALPFRNSTGIAEFHRLLNDPVILPPGTPWTVMAHSQGAAVASQYFLDSIHPNQDRWPYSGFKGACMFGNPYRQAGVVAPWVPDPPDRDTEGLSNIRLTGTPPEWEEVVRKGDLYADTKTGTDATEHKRAIYRAVNNEWTGVDSLAEQIGEIVTGGPKELVAVAVAIIDGIRGAANLDRHNSFELGPCIDHMRRVLNV